MLEEAELKRFHSDMTGLRQLPKIPCKQQRCNSPDNFPQQAIGEGGKGIALFKGLIGFLSTLLCTMNQRGGQKHESVSEVHSSFLDITGTSHSGEQG